MSDLQKGTVKERLARIEILLCNHLAHHSKIEKWMLAIGAVVVGKIIIQVFPDLVKWLASVL